MADDQSPAQTNPPAGAAGGGLQVPPEVQEKFGDLLELIKGSESMNDEERQYWVNILPIMTPEQVQNLREILTNEKQQLAAIDAKYAKDIDAIGQQKFLEQTEAERRRKAEERKRAEESAAKGESADDILKQIEGS